jgi:hypothetical protein
MKKSLVDQFLSRRTHLAILVLALPACLGQPGIGSEEAALTQGAALAQRRADWESVAPTCAGAPSKDGCDDGDMTLFNGLLCGSGETRGCDAVRAAQGPDGRFWRSPRRNPGNLGQPNSFSRDMTLGVLVYLATTHDTGAAQRWLSWIDRNRPCSIKLPFGGSCLVHAQYRVCTDDDNGRCNIDPGLWALMGRVWTVLGLPLHSEMTKWAGWDGDLESWLTDFTSAGYTLHLKAVAIYVREKLGISLGWRLDNAQTLVDKQPLNPFFQYLHDGPTDDVAGRVLALCPQPGSTAPRTQWAWERSDDGQAWLQSMDWDCVFMANLLLQDRP